jgi:rubredoxin
LIVAFLSLYVNLLTYSQYISYPYTHTQTVKEETEEEIYKREKLAEIAERKAKEVFVTQSTGRFECQACGYIYDEAKGYDKKGVAPGTMFASEAMDKFRYCLFLFVLLPSLLPPCILSSFTRLIILMRTSTNSLLYPLLKF